MKKVIILMFVCVFSAISTISAQQESDSKQRNIFEVLQTPELSNNAIVRVYQDERIEKLVVARATLNERGQATTSGFRVQVFSSNVQRTAKGEAFKVEKMMKEEFPDLGVYVNYASPFWKVRVGDFTSQAQAQAFRSQLIEAFPTMRSETYIVREQVLVSAIK